MLSVINLLSVANKPIVLSVIMLSVVAPSECTISYSLQLMVIVIMLNVEMPSVVMIISILLCVVMLVVVTPAFLQLKSVPRHLLE